MTCARKYGTPCPADLNLGKITFFSEIAGRRCHYHTHRAAIRRRMVLRVSEETDRPASSARRSSGDRTFFDRFVEFAQLKVSRPGRRSEEAAQEKLNLIAEALAALMASRAVEDPNQDDAVTMSVVAGSEVVLSAASPV